MVHSKLQSRVLQTWMLPSSSPDSKVLLEGKLRTVVVDEFGGTRLPSDRRVCMWYKFIFVSGEEVARRRFRRALVEETGEMARHRIEEV